MEFIKPELGKCYNATHVKSKKVEYVGKFKERFGGGRYDTGLADYFMRDGKEVSVVHYSPQEYRYTETECQGANAANAAKSRKNRKQRKLRKSRKQRKTRKQ